MVKKLQKLAQKQAAHPAGLLDSQMAQTVKDSAQQIWLAGLGAFSKAQAEGGKVFETLMAEGTKLQKKTQSLAEDRINTVAGKMTAMAGEVGTKAGAQWDKLESIFEERTARAMAKLGAPTARDVAALAARVDELAAAVAKLAGAQGGKSVAKKAAPAKAPAAKAPAAKAAATKAVAAKRAPVARKARA